MSSPAARRHAANTFSHLAFPAARLAAEREEAVSVGPLPSAFTLPGEDEVVGAAPPVERPPLGGLRAVA